MRAADTGGHNAGQGHDREGAPHTDLTPEPAAVDEEIGIDRHRYTLKSRRGGFEPAPTSLAQACGVKQGSAALLLRLLLEGRPQDVAERGAGVGRAVLGHRLLLL